MKFNKQYVFDLLTVCMALIGALTISVFVHEYSHFNDVKEQDATAIDFCVYCFGDCTAVNSVKSAGWVTWDNKNRNKVISSE